MKLLEMLRRKAGMTQKQLADAVGVRQSEVSILENGKHLQMCLERIAAVLGFEGNPADLLCESNKVARRSCSEEAKLRQLLNDVADDNGISPKVAARAYNCLHHNDITAIAQLVKMSTTDLFILRNMGAKSVELCCYAIESINAQGIQEQVTHDAN